MLDLNGAIGPATAEYLHRGLPPPPSAMPRRSSCAWIRRAASSTAMRNIIRDILASPIPVIGYVAPSGARAASAGTYILYATHLAAMAPGTNLGAATPIADRRRPVRRRQREKERDQMPTARRSRPTPQTRKAINDAVAYIRGLAELRGRNVEWAEKAVREAASLPASEALAKGRDRFHRVNIRRTLLAKADGRTVNRARRERTLHTPALRSSEHRAGLARANCSASSPTRTSPTCCCLSAFTG